MDESAKKIYTQIALKKVLMHFEGSLSILELQAWREFRLQSHGLGHISNGIRPLIYCR